MTNPELLPLQPCPFCGSNNIAERVDSICCRDCNAMVNEETIDEAIKVWNTRSPIPTQKLEEEAVFMFLKSLNKNAESKGRLIVDYTLEPRKAFFKFTEESTRNLAQAISSHFSLPRVVSKEELGSIVYRQIVLNNFKMQGLDVKVGEALHTTLYGKERG